jgi:hypothetical protein
MVRRRMFEDGSDYRDTERGSALNLDGGDICEYFTEARIGRFEENKYKRCFELRLQILRRTYYFDI